MSDSPYAPPPPGPAASPHAPPRAVVRDADPQGVPLDRPWQVRRAVQCLWASFVISVISSLQVIAPLYGANTYWVTLVVMVVVNLLNAVLYLMVSKGRNWARLLLIFLVVIWALISVLPLFAPIPASVLADGKRLEIAIQLVNIFLAVIACGLLITGPAGTWFRAMKMARS